MVSRATRKTAAPTVRISLLRSRRLWVFLVLSLSGSGVVLLLRFGGDALIANDSLPPHADVAVMLAGSDSGEEARLDASIHILQEGGVDHVMLGVGRTSFLGEWLPDLLLHYVGRKYRSELAGKVVLCEVSNDVDSTAEEAVALRQCLVARGWRSVIVVTSNYHTRRARLIWRVTLAQSEPHFMLSVQGVSDGDFEPHGWWRKRRYAKSWLLEFTKLAWTCMFEIHRTRTEDRSDGK